LTAGTRLFASTAEDLAASDFGQQRWRVRQTVADFDRSYAADRPPQDPAYRAAAPGVVERYSPVATHLDRIAQFRAEIFEALLGGGATADARRLRDARVVEVARRYRIPTEAIGGR
jgi:hypothetical protein